MLSPKIEISSFSNMGYGLSLFDDFNDDRLSLALEPEVAAMYSQQVAGKEVPIISSSYAKPQNYMVIDIGGRTVDVTIHWDISGKIDVLIPPMGKNWGGTKVNQQFGKFLSTLLGDEDFANFISIANVNKCIANRAAINKLIYNEFENEKVKFGKNVGNIRELRDAQGLITKASITLPSSIIDYYQEDRIRLSIAEHPGLTLNDGVLCMSYQKMAEMFEPTIDCIVNCILTILEQLQVQIETIYLVGGFGGCRYVHSKITESLQEHFPQRNYQVIVPTSPSLATTIGGVTWHKFSSFYSSSFEDEINIVHCCPTQTSKVYITSSDPTQRKLNNLFEYCADRDSPTDVFLKTRGNIAAIDFGTTFCTLTYTTGGDPEVKTLKLNGIYNRVPTAILLHKTVNECRVVEFGYRAQDAFAKMRKSDYVNHIYFERMMILVKDKVRNLLLNLFKCFLVYTRFLVVYHNCNYI